MERLQQFYLRGGTFAISRHHKHQMDGIRATEQENLAVDMTLNNSRRGISNSKLSYSLTQTE